MHIANIDLPSDLPAGAARQSSRLPIACLFSLAVTVGLLLLMRQLVAIDDAAYVEKPPAANLAFHRTVPDRPPKPRDRLPKKPLPPAPPPSALKPIGTSLYDSGGYGVYQPEPPVVGDGGLSVADTRTAIPFLRPAPEYPQRLLGRGVEGWVLVSFTVTRTGAVTDAVVLDSQPRGAFEAAALRTVVRYKYHPQIVGGQPAAMPGVTLRIVFEIDKD